MYRRRSVKKVVVNALAHKRDANALLAVLHNHVLIVSHQYPNGLAQKGIEGTKSQWCIDYLIRLISHPRIIGEPRLMYTRIIISLLSVLLLL